MPHFWDFGRSTPSHHRNLQDGLFQIASQTCSLLVQVNNTNNISYGNNSSNIHLNNLSSGSRSRSPEASGPGAKSGDREQLLVLIPPAEKGCKYKPGLLGKPRLSTVLETSPVQNDDENDVWGHGYMIPSDVDSPPTRWGNKNKWCRPSCIPISIICILIFLVVLLPLLDHAAEKALLELNSMDTYSYLLVMDK